MQVNRFARTILGLAVTGLLLMGGCRSTTTDRMRVLEAGKAEADRRAAELRDELAALRAHPASLLEHDRLIAPVADDPAQDPGIRRVALVGVSSRSVRSRSGKRRAIPCA